jgi:thiol-disulfide isomerase/thioredoxin
MSGSVWLVSYVLLWLAVLVLGFSVVALLRQVGVLHLRVAPMGVHFAGEGPELDMPAPAVAGLGPGNDVLDYSDAEHTVLAFTSPGCEICQVLKPDLSRLDRAYDDVRFEFVDHDEHPEIFGRFKVRSTPYLVAVDHHGLVRARGVANTIDQVEEMLAEVLASPPVEITL